MLYSEFLNGTQATDNKYSYQEYKRIEEIYNNDNSMSKEDAYKLYKKPDAFISGLLEDLEDARSQAREISYKYCKLEKESEELKEDYRKEHSIRVSCQLHLSEAKQKINDLAYFIND